MGYVVPSFDNGQRDALIADYVSGVCDVAQLEQLALAVEHDAVFAAEVGRQLALHRVLRVSQQSHNNESLAHRVLESIASGNSASDNTKKELTERLVADYVNGNSVISDSEYLAKLCEQDPGIAAQVAQHVQIDRVMRTAQRQPINADLVMRALPHRRDSSLTTRVLEQLEQNDQRRRWRFAMPLATAALLLLTLSLGLLLSLQSLPTINMPTTPVAVTVIKQSYPIIRSGPTAQWPNSTRPYDAKGQLIAAQVNLCAGLAEIEMPSGVTMILQGPTVLDITGNNSVRLLLGRATTYVPPHAIGFTIQAEGLEIIDLGTSFGVSQGIDGIADVHVFTGAVEASATIEGLDERKRLFANEAMRIDPRGGKWEYVPCEASRFVFSLRPQQFALDMADMVAGGDGFGSGVADGIDPASGQFMTSSARGYAQSDMQYHVSSAPHFIDGAFIPNGALGDNIITSLGHRFKFPATVGISYDIIRRGGTYDLPRFGGDKQRPGIPPIFGGIDYRNAGHSVIGMHANVGFTLDLHDIAYHHIGMRVVKFTTTVANVGQKGSIGKADFLVLIDGKLMIHDDNLSVKTQPRTINIAITPQNRFLTLVSTDGGNGMGLDWITLGDPRLYLGEAQK